MNLAKNKLRIYKEKGLSFCCNRKASIFKGWRLIIDAFKEFHTRHTLYAKLYFIGDGEDKLQIESYIDSQRLMNNVVLVGAVAREDVVFWINAADLILIGSFFEGWSLSMLESVACGKPIVTTDISGCKRHDNRRHKRVYVVRIGIEKFLQTT